MTPWPFVEGLLMAWLAAGWLVCAARARRTRKHVGRAMEHLNGTIQRRGGAYTCVVCGDPSHRAGCCIQAARRELGDAR